jgi:hemoglobin/transferrin/lactoferrin receptor protein
LSYSGTNLINDETALPTAQYIARETTSFNGEVSNWFAMLNGDLNVGVDFFSDTADIRYDSLVPGRSYIAGEELSNVGVFAQLRLEPTENTRLSTGVRADFRNFTGIDGSGLVTVLFRSNALILGGFTFKCQWAFPFQC